jgi:hypothetical protein
MKKAIFAFVALVMLAGTSRACPPTFFSGFGGCNNFGFSVPFQSFATINVPTVQFVPQFGFQQQLVSFGGFQTLPISFGGFQASPFSSSFGNFRSRNFGNFGDFGGFNGFGGRNFAEFRGRNFEFNGDLGNRFRIRENARGGVRVRSRR